MREINQDIWALKAGESKVERIERVLEANREEDQIDEEDRPICRPPMANQRSVIWEYQHNLGLYK